MITQLNIPSPLPTPIQRVNLIRLVPPLVPAEQYCGIVRARQGEAVVCVLIHSYRRAHVYGIAFPALLPLLQAEIFPDRQMAELTWVDITYTTPVGSRPQLLARTTQLDSATAEIIWQDRDLSYAESWESRVQPAIDLLNLIRMRPAGPVTP